MDSNYRIVVGVDGSEGGRRALEWAVREAAARQGTVQAVATWRWDNLEGGMLPTSAERDLAEQTLEREVQSLSGRLRSTVAIAAEVVEGRAAEALSDAARDADLLVLGSHGHSRVWHTVLGSVSEECIRRATCPVVVVPTPKPAPATSSEPVLHG
ncbi:universal stress protein [Pilimelia columellifera]|uniref:Universal stress protein n=1 Tax=Pilimelia columellifera subsp. columellifera TaxID=706583 RepID=A0ABN3NKV7_9ACTN